jgi:hypothetical protein
MLVAFKRNSKIVVNFLVGAAIRQNFELTVGQLPQPPGREPLPHAFYGLFAAVFVTAFFIAIAGAAFTDVFPRAVFFALAFRPAAAFSAVFVAWNPATA